MPSKIKKSQKKTLLGGIISSDVKDYSNEPVFIKKAQASKEVIKKSIIPKEFLNGKKKLRK